MTIYAGAASPYAVQLTIARPAGATYTLVDATAVSVSVSGPGGISRTWSPSIESSAAASIVVRHVLAADATDVPTAGKYTLRAYVTLPDGVRRTPPFSLMVEPG